MYLPRFLPFILAIIFTLFAFVYAAPVPAANSITLSGRALTFSNDPNDWPTRQQLQVAMATGPDKAFFWSGDVGNIRSEDVAEDLAKAARGLTISMALSRAGLSMPDFRATDPVAADQKWEEACILLAALANGNVFVVQGNLRPGNVFESIEFPALKANKNVKSVIRIDAVTKAKSTLFTQT